MGQRKYVQQSERLCSPLLGFLLAHPRDFKPTTAVVRREKPCDRRVVVLIVVPGVGWIMGAPKKKNVANFARICIYIFFKEIRQGRLLKPSTSRNSC